MDWKTFSATFVTVFVAEIGDKTQFAAMAMSAESRSTVSVLLGAILALSLASVIGVLFGKFLGQWVSPSTLRVAAGLLFIVMGAWILFGPTHA